MTPSAPYPTDPDYVPEDWERYERELMKRRAPKCQATYDEADKLRRRAQKDHRCHVSASLAQRAVETAYLGPCKRAQKLLRRVKAACRG